MAKAGGSKSGGKKSGGTKGGGAKDGGAKDGGAKGGGAKRDRERFRTSMVSSVIAIPLLEDIERQPRKRHDVIIDLNLDYPEGRDEARRRVVELVCEVVGERPKNLAESWPKALRKHKSELVVQYVFGELTGTQIRKLVKLDQASGAARAIYRIWPDFPLEAHITHSVRTVKCDAARVSFSASGAEITWAVMDSGIEKTHPHFAEHGNLELVRDPSAAGESALETSLDHQDFTGGESPLTDELGHGTHVAGIIAGEIPVEAHRTKDATRGKSFRSARSFRDPSGDIQHQSMPIAAIAGMAPQTRLVSLKVLDDRGQGPVSNLIAALAYVQKVNGYGRRLQIHGVNMSVGYSFDPEWFACGQSPLCVEVDRLVRSGVVVVVAAGNSGYGTLRTDFTGPRNAGLTLTINDPGNAAAAITVGATHRDSPHLYGVSYFSSKGPTGDGRNKPDLVAPGEKILSCAAGGMRRQLVDEMDTDLDYREESGTSMAAPHVSGAIAAFLSVRREFLGRPDEVKKLFLDTATDLGRERYFQGHGLLDVMRAMQAV